MPVTTECKLEASLILDIKKYMTSVLYKSPTKIYLSTIREYGRLTKRIDHALENGVIKNGVPENDSCDKPKTPKENKLVYPRHSDCTTLLEERVQNLEANIHRFDSRIANLERANAKLVGALRLASGE